ncbi:hypothetical protein BGZ83_007543 [Gryganskiella cystojenkinii]|nr:hypothetical protein BGZ83_007543 [Gryganskiella cystojenkinii]
MVSIIVILFSSHFFLSPTLAQQQQQPYTPHVVRTPQYLAVNEKTLYIQGGQNASRNSVNQFFALDLTQPWPVSNPAWISLPLGGSSSSPGANNTPSAPTQSQQSITLSQDGQNLMFWSNKANQSISIFNMHSQTWQAPIPNPPGLTQINGLVALTDPTTGNIYVPNGAANMTVGGPKMMQVFNPVIKSSDLRAMPETSQMPSGVVFYTFVWSSVLNGMIMYGVYNGTKMVVFGGINALNGVQGGLYILDIASNTWTQRKPAFPADWRRGMACGAADDYFVAWGGDTGFAGNLVTLTPIIYNVATDQWTNNFRGPNTLPQPGSSNTGAIIGGSVGGLLALAILGLFVYKRHQKHKRINGKTKVNRDSAGMALTDNDVYGSNYAQRRAAGRVASIPAVERHALGPPNHPHSVLLEHVDEENKRRSCEEDGGSDPLQPPPNIVLSDHVFESFRQFLDYGCAFTHCARVNKLFYTTFVPELYLNRTIHDLRLTMDKTTCVTRDTTVAENPKPNSLDMVKNNPSSVTEQKIVQQALSGRDAKGVSYGWPSTLGFQRFLSCTHFQSVLIRTAEFIGAVRSGNIEFFKFLSTLDKLKLKELSTLYADADSETAELDHLIIQNQYPGTTSDRSLCPQEQKKCLARLSVQIEAYEIVEGEVESGLWDMYSGAVEEAVKVYYLLSHLVNLESLQIGCIHKGRFKTMRMMAEENRNPYKVGPYEAQVGPAEVQWMVEHWPSSREIQLDIQGALAYKADLRGVCAVQERWQEVLEEVTATSMMMRVTKAVATTTIESHKGLPLQMVIASEQVTRAVLEACNVVMTPNRD